MFGNQDKTLALSQDSCTSATSYADRRLLTNSQDFSEDIYVCQHLLSAVLSCQ